jgi:hypothetical protein
MLLARCTGARQPRPIASASAGVDFDGGVGDPMRVSGGGASVPVPARGFAPASGGDASVPVAARGLPPLSGGSLSSGRGPLDGSSCGAAVGRFSWPAGLATPKRRHRSLKIAARCPSVRLCGTQK